MRAHRSTVAVTGVLLVLAGVVVAGAALAAAPSGAYPPLTVSSSQLEKGDTLVVHGQGCSNASSVNLEGYYVELLNGEARMAFTDTPPWDPATGTWTASTRIGEDFPAGRYVVQASCFDTTEGVPYGLVPVVVLPEADPPISGGLAVEPAVGPAGTDVTVAASPFYGDLDVGFFLNPGRRFLGSAPSDDPTGTAVLQATIPDDLGPGAYQVLAQGTNGGLATLAGSFTVPAAAPTPAAPPAGSDDGPAEAAPVVETTTTAAPSSTTSSSSTTTQRPRPTTTADEPDDIEVLDEGSGGAGWLVGMGTAAAVAAAGAAAWRRRRPDPGEAVALEPDPSTD